MQGKVSGKLIILIMFIVALVLTALRWKLVPRQNPKAADPGNPYYTPKPKNTPPAADSSVKP